MADITDPKQAGERLLQFARENRLAQRTWRAEQDGREVACLLGAAAGISDAKECPASLMPRWLAHALPGLFDGQTADHAFAFARRWGEAMIRPEWARIDWDAVRGEWMAFVVKQAQDAAAAAAAAAARADAYVASAADAAAAWAADAARAAAYAASAAAYAAADVAAAADAAAWAADAARAAAYAADFASASAAKAAARSAQADALMDAIEKAMEVARG